MPIHRCVVHLPRPKQMEPFDKELTERFVTKPVRKWRTAGRGPRKTRSAAFADAQSKIDAYYGPLLATANLSETDRIILNRDRDEVIKWAKEATAWYFVSDDPKRAQQQADLAALVNNPDVEKVDALRLAMKPLVADLETLSNEELGYTMTVVHRAKLIQLRVAAGAPSLDGPNVQIP